MVPRIHLKIKELAQGIQMPLPILTVDLAITGFTEKHVMGVLFMCISIHVLVFFRLEPVYILS